MLSTLAIILGFGLVIGLHEAAHMLVSKLFGVRVLKFSMGFGPRLLAFKPKKSETEYELRLLPLGGFVQMAGEDPESNVNGGFFSVPWWKRSLIALAGPVANLLLAYVLFVLAFSVFSGNPLGEALSKAWQVSVFIVTVTLGWLGSLLGLVAVPDAVVASGATSASESIAGPIMIVKMMALSFTQGPGPFTALLGIISLSLGMFNLFPIPGLDGGHLALYAVEGLRGKKLPSRVYQVWGMVGFVLLMSLMAWVILADITKLLK